MLSSYFKKLTEQIQPFILWLEDTAIPFMQAVLMAVLFWVIRLIIILLSIGIVIQLMKTFHAETTATKTIINKYYFNSPFNQLCHG